MDFPLTGKQEQQRFIMLSGVTMIILAVGNAAQVAAGNGLGTPQSAVKTDPPMPQPATLWPSPRQRLTIFSSESVVKVRGGPGGGLSPPCFDLGPTC